MKFIFHKIQPPPKNPWTMSRAEKALSSVNTHEITGLKVASILEIPPNSAYI